MKEGKGKEGKGKARERKGGSPVAVPSRVPAQDDDTSCTCKNRILEWHCESINERGKIAKGGGRRNKNDEENDEERVGAHDTEEKCVHDKEVMKNRADEKM